MPTDPFARHGARVVIDGPGRHPNAIVTKRAGTPHGEGFELHMLDDGLLRHRSRAAAGRLEATGDFAAVRLVRVRVEDGPAG